MVRPENCLSYEVSRSEPYTKLYLTDRSIRVAWAQASIGLWVFYGMVAQNLLRSCNILNTELAGYPAIFI